jgi:hypothetical protein
MDPHFWLTLILRFGEKTSNLSLLLFAGCYYIIQAHGAARLGFFFK